MGQRMTFSRPMRRVGLRTKRAGRGKFLGRLAGEARAALDHFGVRGGQLLKGKVEIGGSEGSALPILADCLMADVRRAHHSLARLSVVDSMNELMGGLACHVYRHDSRES